MAGSRSGAAGLERAVVRDSEVSHDYRLACDERVERCAVPAQNLSVLVKRLRMLIQRLGVLVQRLRVPVKQDLVSVEVLVRMYLSRDERAKSLSVLK